MKEWCANRNLDVVECDLRWGVPSDSTSDDTIMTCLGELDRCYEDNGENPFFIGMISEKYKFDQNKKNIKTFILKIWLDTRKCKFKKRLG